MGYFTWTILRPVIPSAKSFIPISIIKNKILPETRNWRNLSALIEIDEGLRAWLSSRRHREKKRVIDKRLLKHLSVTSDDFWLSADSVQELHYSRYCCVSTLSVSFTKQSWPSIFVKESVKAFWSNWSRRFRPVISLFFRMISLLKPWGNHCAIVLIVMTV